MDSSDLSEKRLYLLEKLEKIDQEVKILFPRPILCIKTDNNGSVYFDITDEQKEKYPLYHNKKHILQFVVKYDMIYINDNR